MTKTISVPIEIRDFLLCQCGRAEECGLRQTPPNLDELDIAKLWLPVRFINFISDSTFLDMQNAGPNKMSSDFPNREAAVREYIKETKKKVKLSKQDTYPAPMGDQADGALGQTDATSN